MVGPFFFTFAGVRRVTFGREHFGGLAQTLGNRLDITGCGLDRQMPGVALNGGQLHAAGGQEG